MSTGSMMANDGNEPHGEGSGGKTDHRATYENFMAVTKWAVIAIAVALILMAIFLA